MNTKSIFTSIISIIIFSVLFGYSLVYAGTNFFSYPTSIIFKLSDNIFLDSISLNRTQIIFNSTKDLSNYKIKSKCDIFSKLKHKMGNRYMFDIKFFNNDCNDNHLVLVDENNNIEKSFKLNIVREYNALSNLLDIKTDNLLLFDKILKQKTILYKNYAKYNPEIEKNYYTYLKKNRLLKESIYNEKLINNIITKRNEKYRIPVPGHVLPIKLSKIPNAGRPYRKSYTDGIHHGWDIDGKKGEQVVAIDDGIIVRVVSDFKFSDLNYINKGKNLSTLDKLKNLDRLRGNQVWLKTMKGDVIFYSHLSDIFTNIKVGEVVKKGQPIGLIGSSGVPDKNYTDFHLHFPIQVNPKLENKVGKYDIDDYLKWDWMFKGKSSNYILKNQYSVFES